jgi:hypothetical protein
MLLPLSSEAGQAQIRSEQDASQARMTTHL